PKYVSTLAHLCAEAKYSEARDIHYKLLEITELCFVEGNPCGVKYILKELGFGEDYVRLPLVRVSSKTQQRIQEAMRSL
ncbi:MAG TPA: dihydrodipicolinate synthase family protein, partial [Cytophagaceae bacterium]